MRRLYRKYDSNIGLKQGTIIMGNSWYVSFAEVDGSQPVWPEKNRQMSIQVTRKWFHKKNNRFWHLGIQKLPKNVGYLGNIIVAKGFQSCLKCKKIAQSGPTAASWGSDYTNSFQHGHCKCAIQYVYTTSTNLQIGP